MAQPTSHLPPQPGIPIPGRMRTETIPAPNLQEDGLPTLETRTWQKSGKVPRWVTHLALVMPRTSLREEHHSSPMDLTFSRQQQPSYSAGQTRPRNRGARVSLGIRSVRQWPERRVGPLGAGASVLHVWTLDLVCQPPFALSRSDCQHSWLTTLIGASPQRRTVGWRRGASRWYRGGPCAETQAASPLKSDALPHSDVWVASVHLSLIHPGDGSDSGSRSEWRAPSISSMDVPPLATREIKTRYVRRLYNEE